VADDTVRRLRVYYTVLRQHSVKLRTEAQQVRQLTEAARKKLKCHQGQQKVAQPQAVDAVLTPEPPQPD
jgi:hypothetical protein